jgi:hypothetical protein
LRRVPDYRLVQIPDLHIDFALGVGNRAEIAHMAIASYPDFRTFR